MTSYHNDTFEFLDCLLAFASPDFGNLFDGSCIWMHLEDTQLFLDVYLLNVRRMIEEAFVSSFSLQWKSLLTFGIQPAASPGRAS